MASSVLCPELIAIAVNERTGRYERDMLRVGSQFFVLFGFWLGLSGHVNISSAEDQYLIGMAFFVQNVFPLGNIRHQRTGQQTTSDQVLIFS